MLCPDDWSLLRAQNSQGTDKEWFHLEFKTCGDSPGCNSGFDNFLEYNKYFSKFYFKIKYVTEGVDLTQIDDQNYLEVKPMRIITQDLFNYQLQIMQNFRSNLYLRKNLINIEMKDDGVTTSNEHHSYDIDRNIDSFYLFNTV